MRGASGPTHRIFGGGWLTGKSQRCVLETAMGLAPAPINGGFDGRPRQRPEKSDARFSRAQHRNPQPRTVFRLFTLLASLWRRRDTPLGLDDARLHEEIVERIQAILRLGDAILVRPIAVQ